LLFVALPLSALAQFPIGTDDLTLFDPARDDRPVPVDLYYPAVAAGDGQPPADPPASGFAAVAVGHGYQMSAGVYGWLGERLAAAGFVVGVPRTGGELFPDHGEFGLDLAFVARALRDAGQDATSPLFGRMNDAAVVMGHSMGGGASLLALASDPGLTAAATFAAAETDPSAIAACATIDRPSLFFAGTNDCVTPPAEHQIPMYEALAGGWRTLATLDGASHCQFAEYSFICSLGEFCSADISRAEQHDLTWSLLEPWLRAVALDDASQVAVFQDRLAGTPGVDAEQAGQPTAAPAPVVGAPGLVAAPNPFNPRTSLHLELPEATMVELRIHDARGRLVRAFAPVRLTAGAHAWPWDGRDHRGRELAAGVYLATVSTSTGTTTTRVALVR
jgi:pimeloyl-ACP methyl ester carboxylesterase